jgi:2Fe-2S ferredoxin
MECCPMTRVGTSGLHDGLNGSGGQLLSATYIQADGSETTIEAPDGTSIMQAAITNGVPGILAECGGAASCATCHVYVDEAWLERLPLMGDDENEMLDCTAAERRPNSRLSCQIELSSDLDGIVVRMPETQS